jgi:hypothetical protein
MILDLIGELGELPSVQKGISLPEDLLRQLVQYDGTPWGSSITNFSFQKRVRADAGLAGPFRTLSQLDKTDF